MDKSSKCQLKQTNGLRPRRVGGGAGEVGRERGDGGGRGIQHGAV